MQRKKYLTGMVVSLLLVFISGCISTKGSSNPMSSEKEAELYLKMGVRYLEMDMLKIAKEKLLTAASLDGANAEVQSILAVLYGRLQQYDLARKHYQEAIELDTNNASITNNYGRFLCERKEFQAGLRLLNQALLMPLNNRKWFAYTNIGICKVDSGQQKLAEADFRKALELNKKYPPALLEMQKISFYSGKYLSARAFLERYLSVAQHTAETLWIAVQTERALGSKRMAESYRERLLNQFPNSSQAKLLKAQ